MPDAYSIHDVKQYDQPGVNLSGQIEIKRVVTFYAGDHGPFRLEYSKSEATGDRIQQDMNREIQQLRMTDQLGK